MPFVTEEIWSAIGEAEPSVTAGEPLLIRARWPGAAETDPDADAAFEQLASLVRGIRNLRTEAGTPAAAWVPLVVAPTDHAAEAAIRGASHYLETLARVRPIELGGNGGRPTLVAASPLGAAWLGIDPAAEERAGARRSAQVAELEANAERLRALLGKESFVQRAPAEVVERERARLAALEAELEQLREP
jgi:valyl-tRNA synthetase